MMMLAAVQQFKRPTLTGELAMRNIGRAGGLTAGRSTPARSANHELE